MRSFRLLAVAVLVVVLALSSTQNAFAAEELSYDDGSAEDTFWTPVDGYCYANRFVQGESNWPAGWSSVRVLTARFYVNSETAYRQVTVRVLDSAKNDLMTALTLTHPHMTVWWDVDLSAYDVVASGEFYLVWQQVDANTAGPGGDRDSGFKSRSYRGGSPNTWILDPNRDNFLIRAVVEDATPTPASAPVGGVVIPVNTFAVLAPWLAVIGLVGCIGAVVVVAKKRRQ
jgi:hypothetical protein